MTDAERLEAIQDNYSYESEKVQFLLGEIKRLQDTLTARNAGQVECERQVNELVDQLAEAEKREDTALNEVDIYLRRAEKAEMELAEAQEKLRLMMAADKWADVELGLVQQATDDERRRCVEVLRGLEHGCNGAVWDEAIREAIERINKEES